MLDPAPDFDSYSLGDLLDAQSHIDREKYPDRAERIDRLVAERVALSVAAPESLSLLSSSHPYFEWLVRRPNAILDRALWLLALLGLALLIAAVTSGSPPVGTRMGLSLLAAGLPMILHGLREANKKPLPSDGPASASWWFKSLGGGCVFVAVGLVILLAVVVKLVRAAA